MTLCGQAPAVLLDLFSFYVGLDTILSQTEIIVVLEYCTRVLSTLSTHQVLEYSSTRVLEYSSTYCNTSTRVLEYSSTVSHGVTYMYNITYNVIF